MKVPLHLLWRHVSFSHCKKSHFMFYSSFMQYFSYFRLSEYLIFSRSRNWWRHFKMATMFDTYERTYRNMLFSRMLMKECRLKTLRDLCLDCVGKNLHCITRSSQYLAPLHKELIIERLAFHDRFTESYLPHVTYNLFSPRLERINLYKCDQINDKWMQKLAESKCRLRFLTIHQCENVKG